MSSHSRNEIDAKARATAELMLQALLEPDMCAPAWEAYSRVRDELTRRNLARPADVPIQQSIQRLLFEVIAFAAFIVMAQELPKWLTRKNPLGEEEPDVEWIPYFNTQFLDRLGRHMKSLEFARLREVIVSGIHPTITFAEGEPLIVERRVAEYVRVDAPTDAGRHFSRLAAMAMDAEHTWLLQPITVRFIGSIVGIDRIVLKGVFTRQLTADPHGS